MGVRCVGTGVETTKEASSYLFPNGGSTPIGPPETLLDCHLDAQLPGGSHSHLRKGLLRQRKVLRLSQVLGRSVRRTVVDSGRSGVVSSTDR